MYKKKTNILFFLIFTALLNGLIIGQSRSVINKGVDKYEEGNFTEAEKNFKESIDDKFENYEGHFNLGDALYKQDKYEDALSYYKNALALAETDEQKAQVFHNVGNTLLKSQKLDESIEAYTQSLKLNPKDPETKYNLSYALKQKQKQDEQDQNKDQNKDKKEDQDKNKDQNKEDQQKQDQNKDEENKDQQNQDDQKDQQEKDKQDQQQQQQPPPEISKEEAGRILNALKDDEKDIQKELRKQKGKKVKVEKDW